MLWEIIFPSWKWRPRLRTTPIKFSSIPWWFLNFHEYSLPVGTGDHFNAILPRTPQRQAQGEPDCLRFRWKSCILGQAASATNNTTTRAARSFTIVLLRGHERAKIAAPARVLVDVWTAIRLIDVWRNEISLTRPVCVIWKVRSGAWQEIARVWIRVRTDSFSGLGRGWVSTKTCSWCVNYRIPNGVTSGLLLLNTEVILTWINKRWIIGHNMALEKFFGILNSLPLGDLRLEFIAVEFLRI